MKRYHVQRAMEYRYIPSGHVRAPPRVEGLPWYTHPQRLSRCCRSIYMPTSKIEIEQRTAGVHVEKEERQELSHSIVVALCPSITNSSRT